MNPAETGPSALAAPFSLLAALRRGRAFHPRGAAYRAQVVVHPGAHGLQGLGPTVAATVRVSRGVGLPRPLPDVQGIGICVRDGTTEVHLLLATSLRIGRIELPFPLRTAASERYSTITTFRDVRGDRTRVHATLQPDAMPVVELRQVAGRRSVAMATVTAFEALPDADAPRLDPSRAPQGLIPAGWVNRLRGPAYDGSRRARPSGSSIHVCHREWGAGRDGQARRSGGP